MLPAALDQMRLANSTLERTKARLAGCVDRMKELQDRVRQLKRDKLAVDSVSRRLVAPKYEVCFVSFLVTACVEIQQKENRVSLHKHVQRVSKVSDADTSIKLFCFICGCRCCLASSRSMKTTPR